MSGNNHFYLLEVKGLKTRFCHDGITVHAVNGIDLKVNSGQAIGIVGESGCGKTMTTYSIMNILPSSGQITSGKIIYKKRDGSIIDIAKFDQEDGAIRKIRGSEISMIFQEPMTAFSPVHTIGNQIIETIILHHKTRKAAARKRVIELMGLVGISNPEQRIDQYPFQFSGGMRQRAMIAMALACNPQLIIADEPTSALDVTISAQVLQLLKEMQQEFNLAMILITHDLGVVAHMVDYLYVMYLGRFVEEGRVEEIFENPQHPYTRDLLKSIPKLSGNKGRLASIKGSVPDILPSGCSFHPRCQERVGDICSQQFPATKEVAPDHWVSCFQYTAQGVREDGKDA